MENRCYLNGAIVPVSAAKVSVYDIGLLRGFGIYEALRTFDRKPFMLADHFARFHRSTAAMKLNIPLSDEKIAQIIDELIASNIPAGKEAKVKFILTGGPAINDIEFDPQAPTFYMLAEELREISEDVLRSGCRVLVHEHQRIFAEFKTTNYINAVLLQEERKRAGALEILYTHQGHVLECAASNFFIIRRGVIVTAKDNILEGITRKVVLGLVSQEFPLEERDISVSELDTADEAFLTSSFKNIVPVVAVGDKKIGDGTPGPVTKRVMELFRARTASRVL